MVGVRIPKRNKEVFNLYVNGNPLDCADLNDRGTLFYFSGIFILQYKYSHHRRVYIAAERRFSNEAAAMYLPNVKKPVSVLYFISGGRRIDFMRQAVFNLEKIGGKEIYSLPVVFWQKFSCLLDTCNGHTSKATKSNIMILYEKYKFYKLNGGQNDKSLQGYS